ncbi:uncharacterized protein L201_005434 [Kwoniella dendrophila CBS 6074]|uniref:GH18 domain-containing protein n=1 Tax=Kwoniella dendrophila CBS 6074 TaxID=1295534 RepID=A0AAX4K0A4_9TREE
MVSSYHLTTFLPFLHQIVATAIPAIPRGGLHHPEPRSSGAELEERQSDGTGWHGYRSIGYYPNWVIYGDDTFPVTDINGKDFTHIIYAFANVNLNSGQVFLGDDWADTQYPYPGDNPDNESGNNLYGNLKQLFLLKKQNRNLKIQLGVGGASYSSNFNGIINQQWRETFTTSAIDLVTDLGFEGLCLDYVRFNSAALHGLTSGAHLSFYSPNAQQTAPLVDLFRRLRIGLNSAASQIGGGHFLLSWAAACGAQTWGNQDIPGMDQYLDYWNLMAYDFSGSWTDTALPASNLYSDGRSSDVNASGSQCLQHYISSGVDSRKLNLGLPLYGTGFTGTQGMWTPWTGTEQYNTAELPLSGDTVTYNQTLGGSWSYNPSNGRVVSFDTPTLAVQKAIYIIQHNIGGMMYWSIDGDYSKLQPVAASQPGNNGNKCGVPIDTDIGVSLVDTVVTAFKRYGNGLDTTQNRLSYPTSEYDNLRKGFN